MQFSPKMLIFHDRAAKGLGFHSKPRVMHFDFEIRNFMAIRQAALEKRSNVVVLLGPNKTGKTQLLFLLYALYWASWNIAGEANADKEAAFEQKLKSKLKGVFLVKNPRELISWQEKQMRIEWGNKDDEEVLTVEATQDAFLFKGKPALAPAHSPTFIAPLIGEYYKGILALQKVSPSWRLVSEAVSDFINDLFLYADRQVSSPLLQHMEKWSGVNFFLQSNRIYARERGRQYKIERAASGLKSLASTYLALRHGLINEAVFVDEPESGLHPSFAYQWAKWLSQLAAAKPDTTFYLATHSEYVLEGINVALKEGLLPQADLWFVSNFREIEHGDAEGALWKSTVATAENPLDSSLLSRVYSDLLRHLYGVKSA
ncbi:MAG: ATP-binding protein [Gammaproteobacteria bacterium]|nr:MAG: ATP-binding protein [Gammaproteobacteria bacterium]